MAKTTTPAKGATTAKRPARARATSATTVATRRTRATTTRAVTPGTVRLLSGGNPQIAKADGDDAVQAYIAAMPGWKRDIGRRLDALITRTIPRVKKAVKWNSPFYGLPGQGWLVSYHVFERYVKVVFFNGRIFTPPVPGGKSKDSRWIDIHEDDFDEPQLTSWIRQAAALPGWGKV